MWWKESLHRSFLYRQTLGNILSNLSLEICHASHVWYFFRFAVHKLKSFQNTFFPLYILYKTGQKRSHLQHNGQILRLCDIYEFALSILPDVPMYLHGHVLTDFYRNFGARKAGGYASCQYSTLLCRVAKQIVKVSM